MSNKLPILLAIAGVAYFISTASAEEGDDISGCMEVTACNYDSTATVDSGDCKYGDSCDDDPYFPPENPCDNIDTSEKWRDATLVTPTTYFDDDRDDDASAWDGNAKSKISQVRVNQKDYVPGSQVNIEFDAQVKNRSLSRCGDNILCIHSCPCWFAPTNGEIVGNNEGRLEFEVSIVPHRSVSAEEQALAIPVNSQSFPGSSHFTVYSNESEFERDELLDNGYGEDSNLRQLENATARYAIGLTIPSTTTSLGSYDIVIKTGLQGNWNSKKFRGFIVIPNAFNVEECETPSEAENYETRFMSNQSFMTL